MVDVNLTTIALLMIIGYIVLYLSGRKYLETFEDPKKRFDADGRPQEHQNMNVVLPESSPALGIPYGTNFISDLDSYELSAVYQNQSSKPDSRADISDAMTRYPMDWSVQGPDSQYFQEQKAAFEKKLANSAPPPTSMYNGVDGTNMAIPDTEAQNEEETKILQTYQPECSKGLLQYSLDDVKHLLDKVYSKRGLIPVIEKSKQGENIWEVTEVKEKNPKIVWEDEVARDVQRETMEKRMEQVIQVPYTVSDLSAGLDPFFQARNPVRDDKYDYTQWTPGLERMFAPTYPLKSWF